MKETAIFGVHRGIIGAMFVLVIGLAWGRAIAQPQEKVPPLKRQQDKLDAYYEKYGGEPRKESFDYQASYRWYAPEFFTDPKALEICSAIEATDVETIARRIDEGFDVDHRGEEGMTLLLYSLAFPGKATRCLLEKGADPNLPVDSGRGGFSAGTTATQIIAGFGSPADFEYILDHGTDPHMLAADTYVPLIRYTFTSTANCKILLDKGVDVNQQDANRGCTIRSIGYPTGSPETLLLYLRAGGDYRTCAGVWPNLLLDLAGYKARWGTPPQMLQPPERWTEVADWFKTQEGIDPAKVLADFEAYGDEIGEHWVLRSTLAFASPHRWLPAEKDRESQFFDDPQVVELVLAIGRDDLDEINRLAEAGVDFNAKGKGGVTPLFWATQASLPAFSRVLSSGVDLNAQLSSTFYPIPTSAWGRVTRSSTGRHGTETSSTCCSCCRAAEIRTPREPIVNGHRSSMFSILAFWVSTWGRP